MQMVLKNSEAFPFVYLQLIDVVGTSCFLDASNWQFLKDR